MNAYEQRGIPVFAECSGKYLAIGLLFGGIYSPYSMVMASAPIMLALVVYDFWDAVRALDVMGRR